MDSSRSQVFAAFDAAVNMPADELEEWLKTKESLSVGYKGKDGTAPESVGHAAGRRLVVILRSRREELSDEDVALMRKAYGFIRRLSAQRPINPFSSRWRYSLKNWGYDPVKNLDLW